MHVKLKVVSKLVNVLFLRGKNLSFGGDSKLTKNFFVSLTNQPMRLLFQVLFSKYLHSFIYVKWMFFSC